MNAPHKSPGYADFYNVPTPSKGSRRIIKPPALKPEEPSSLVLMEPEECTDHERPRTRTAKDLDRLPKDLRDLFPESPKSAIPLPPLPVVSAVPPAPVPAPIITVEIPEGEYEPQTQERVAISRGTVDKILTVFTWKIFKYGGMELPYFKSNNALYWKVEIPCCTACGAFLRIGPRFNHIPLGKDGNSIACPSRTCRKVYKLKK